ncbi:hypothetical protein GOP47_0008232 [Adiantum capillus-veneris]|uniref:TLC domain-containing protein n=1 Tax=Adiantum capillus-veneris TaxID=13818 RepID=A0A9D4UZB8_ADICA|nr:hypothetical protein GOP47_0008232 [Adiantum capillus-veneris]
MLSLAAGNPWAEPILWFFSVTLGIIGCRVVYNVMQTSSPIYSSAYLKLSKLEKVEWDNRGFSTAHAIVVSMIAAYLLFLSDFFRDNETYGSVVFRSSIFSQVILGVSIGYFISDLAMILWFYPALGGKEYVLHHLLSMSSLAMSVYSGQGHFYLYVVLFSEITTPFVNLRWYLSKAGMKNSSAYVLNGVLLFLGWLIARVLLFIYFFVHLYLHYDQVKQVFTIGFYYLFIAPPALALMNLFWFYKVATDVEGAGY